MNTQLRTLSTALFCLFTLASSAVSQQPPPAAAARVTPDMKQMQHIEDQWDDALAKKDQYGLELVMSPQFIDISSAGEVTTRNQQIARLFLKEGGALQKLEQKVVTVRMYGDISLVNGTYTLHKRENGAEVEERGVFTHVFQRVRTNWQCINSQRTIVVEENLTKPKAAKKASPAELPMHVPLIYKGADPAPAAPAQQGTPAPPK
jgi:ketosteroid isomerase-like protein